MGQWGSKGGGGGVKGVGCMVIKVWWGEGQGGGGDELGRSIDHELLIHPYTTHAPYYSHPLTLPPWMDFY